MKSRDRQGRQIKWVGHKKHAKSESQIIGQKEYNLEAQTLHIHIFMRMGK